MMRALYLIILLALAWPTSGASQAELWLVVASTSGSVTSIDSLSIKVVGTDLVELRVRKQFSPAREQSRGRYDFIRYDTHIVRTRLHCTKLRSMDLESVHYQGTVQVQRDYGSAGKPRWGQPFGAADQRLAERACGIALGSRTQDRP